MGGFEENADVICLSTYQSLLESKQQDKSTCCFELLFFFFLEKLTNTCMQNKFIS